MGVRQTTSNGNRAWLKRYAPGTRRLRLTLLRASANYFDLPPLRPPPRYGGSRSCAIETRRLRELRHQGIRVPEILEENREYLLLSDLGSTLSSRLRATRDDYDIQNTLIRNAMDSISQAHAVNGYFGQLVPRNMTIDSEENVGFIDFEEDPLEVMTLQQAQARDWMFFTFGVVKYCENVTALHQMFHRVFLEQPKAVICYLEKAAQRLTPLERWCRLLGKSTRPFSHALTIFKTATGQSDGFA